VDKITTLEGTYRFYQDGELVSEATNLITDAGKDHIIRFMSGQTRVLAGTIAIGTGAAVPASTDTYLTYEFDRATIYLTAPDFVNRTLVFKGTLPATTIGTIYEVGLYSGIYSSISNGTTPHSLASFETGLETWDTGTYTTTRARIGTVALRVSPAASASVTSVLPSVGLDLSGYAGNDDFVLAFYNTNSNAASVRVRLRDATATSYYEYTITNPITGYNVVRWDKSAMTITGTPNFAAIGSIELTATAKASGAATIDYDGFRIEPGTLDPDNILISRAVLATPVVKAGLKEMDVEYALKVTL
jgi:hypothetical protein